MRSIQIITHTCRNQLARCVYATHQNGNTLRHSDKPQASQRNASFVVVACSFLNLEQVNCKLYWTCCCVSVYVCVCIYTNIFLFTASVFTPALHLCIIPLIMLHPEKQHLSLNQSSSPQHSSKHTHTHTHTHTHHDMRKTCDNIVEYRENYITCVK